MKDPWKAILKGDGELLLYDIVNDPAELNDLKATHPDLANELRNSIAEWKNEVRRDLE